MLVAALLPPSRSSRQQNRAAWLMSKRAAPLYLKALWLPQE